MKTTILAAPDIRAIVEHVGLDAIMDENIRRIHVAIREYDPSLVQVSIRDGFHYTYPHVGLLEMMPVRVPGEEATIKIVGYHPANPELRDLPTILATVAVFEAESGHLTGLVDGTFLTAVRTAAASAIASKHLALPASRTLGLIGCGGQSVAQLHAISRVFDLERVLAYDLVPARAESLAERVSRFRPSNLEIESRPLDDVVAQSDIICTQTSVGVGEGPVFEDGPTRPHLHVNAVGADLPKKFEVPVSLLKRSLVVPDFPAQTALEGECQRLEPGDVGPSLIEVVQDPDRHVAARERTTVFDSTGFALEDHVTAAQLFEYARDIGVGTEVDMECSADDPWDPYGFVKG
jgi:ornithine cyclodeaminase